MTKTFYVLSRQASDTDRIAAIVASHLHVGDLLLLTGPLACGKTHFVKGLAAALGCKEIVTSPTYALLHSYRTAAAELMHIDAYRLGGTPEFLDLGLEEYFAESIVVIEWGDKVAEVFSDYLSISFDLGGVDINHRLLAFTSVGERWAGAMAKLEKQLGGSGDGSLARH